MKKTGMFWNSLEVKNLTINPAELRMSVDELAEKAQIVQVIILPVANSLRRIRYNVALSGWMQVSKAQEVFNQYSLEWVNKIMEEHHQEHHHPISEV
jgi:hypothetical protein